MFHKYSDFFKLKFKNWPNNVTLFEITMSRKDDISPKLRNFLNS